MASYYDKREAMDEIRFWYDGYRFGNTEIYNPWSVTNYFASGGQAKPYWANTSDNEIIRGILMEFKAVSVSEKDKLSELAEEALAQTEEKNYQRDLEDHSVRDIVRYGIAFSGKSAEVRMTRRFRF